MRPVFINGFHHRSWLVVKRREFPVNTYVILITMEKGILKLIPNTEVRKQLLSTREGFGPGQLSYFSQDFWMEPLSILARHRHPVMRELIMAVYGDLDIVLQDEMEGPETLIHIPAGELVVVNRNTLHTLMNRTGMEVQGFAAGFILEPNGKTIYE